MWFVHVGACLIVHYTWKNSSNYMLHGGMKNVAYALDLCWRKLKKRRISLILTQLRELF